MESTEIGPRASPHLLIDSHFGIGSAVFNRVYCIVSSIFGHWITHIYSIVVSIWNHRIIAAGVRADIAQHLIGMPVALSWAVGNGTGIFKHRKQKGHHE